MSEVGMIVPQNFLIGSQLKSVQARDHWRLYSCRYQTSFRKPIQSFANNSLANVDGDVIVGKLQTSIIYAASQD